MKFFTIFMVAMLCACTPPQPTTSANTNLYRVDYQQDHDLHESLGYCDIPCKPDMHICYERKNGKCQVKIQQQSSKSI